MSDLSVWAALRAACEQRYGDHWAHMFPAEQRGAVALMAADVRAFLLALPNPAKGRYPDELAAAVMSAGKERGQ